MSAQARLDRDVFKCAVTIVKKQLVGRRLVHLGMAIVAVTDLFPTNRFVLWVPLQIINDDEIQQSVIVHIDPHGADRPERTKLTVGLVEASPFGDIGEGAVPVVVVERVVMQARYEDIFVTIVVVVSDGDADIIASARKSSLFGNVLKLAVAFVLE